MGPTPQYVSGPGGAEVLAQAQGLVLVRRAEPHTIDTGRPAPQPLEPYLERDLAIVDQKWHLARPYLHNNLGAKHAPVAEAEAGVEEPRVMRTNLPGPGVVHHHLGRVVGGHPDALLGDQDVEPVGLEDVGVAAGPLDRLP